MSKKNANTNKFLAGAITATMVATAIVPVAASADENTTVDFSDVDKSSSHYENIVKAAERGLMTGYEGKFNPLADMTRGQVVKALGKYLVGQEELTLDAYIEKYDLVNEVTAFHDVPANASDQELYKYSLVVKDAGAFTGDQGYLKASNHIKREQMSKVLVEAFELEAVEDAEANVADMNDVQAQYADYVTILSQHEITKADDNKFRPKGNVTRQQMASFLNRSYDVVHEEIEEIEQGVQTVAAINQSIANGKEQELTFTVNGEAYTAKTFNEKYGEEGYTVKFFYNKETDQDNTYAENGIVNVKEEGTFKFSAQVTDEEGNKLPVDATNAKHFAEVEVKSDAIEKVTEVRLSNGLNYVPMNIETVSFEATKGINGLGQEVLPTGDQEFLAEDVVKFNRAESSDSTIAYVEDKKIVPVKTGTVTFDVYFTNVKDPVQVTVEIKAAQKATSIEPIEDMKVQTGSVKLAEVTVLDQYGEVMDAAPVIKVTDKDNKEVVVNDSKVNLPTAGLYTVKVFASNDENAKQLGSYTIETVKVDENTKPDAYELHFSKNENKVMDTLDIENPAELEIAVVGKVDGVEIDKTQFHTGLNAKASDDSIDVAYADGKVTVKFVENKTPEVGNVTITLYHKKGTMVTNLQTTTVKVVNTAAQVTELKLADEKATTLTTAKVDDQAALEAANTIGHFGKKDIVAQLTAGKDSAGKEIFKEGMIEEVKFIERVLNEKAGKLTGKVQVKLKAKYGGQTFVFDAEVLTKTALESAVITKSVEGEQQEIKFTFSEAVELQVDDKIKIGDKEATVATVADNVVVVTVAEGTEIEENTAATFTVLKSGKYVDLKDVFFGDITVTK